MMLVQCMRHFNYFLGQESRAAKLYTICTKMVFKHLTLRTSDLSSVSHKLCTFYDQNFTKTETKTKWGENGLISLLRKFVEYDTETYQLSSQGKRRFTIQILIYHIFTFYAKYKY